MNNSTSNNLILPKYLILVKKKGSSLALPANGLGGSRATSLSVAHFALQNTKFGNEKGKVQKPARIPPQTPPAGGTEAEAGQFHSPRKIVCPAESALFPFHSLGFSAKWVLTFSNKHHKRHKIFPAEDFLLLWTLADSNRLPPHCK